MLQAAVRLLVSAALWSSPSNPTDLCSIRTAEGEPRRLTVATTQEMVAEASVVVRARAVEADSMDIAEQRWPAVRFRVLEVVKGEVPASGLMFMGWLTDEPDFNPGSVPYLWVRREGQRGSCFAYGYQRGGEFLLLLREVRGRLTPYWKSLRPLNEQIRGADDPWVTWLREELARGAGAETRDGGRTRVEVAG